MDKVYLSDEGYQKMHEELEYLTTTKRREIASTLEIARALGDLKENAEYHAAKDAQAFMEARISELQDKLSRVEIIDDTGIDPDKAYVGAKVVLKDLETDDEIDYKLVGQDEADPMEGLLSVESPVGKALLGKSVGDSVEIEVPAGILKYEIIKVAR